MIAIYIIFHACFTADCLELAMVYIALGFGGIAGGAGPTGGILNLAESVLDFCVSD